MNLKTSTLFICLLVITTATHVDDPGEYDEEYDEGEDDDGEVDPDEDYDDYEQNTELPPPETTDDYQSFDVSTLRLANVLYRHGDRSQTHDYANDLYQESDWPQGFGQLSRKGMAQEYSLGKYLNQRYIESDFLSPVYQRNDIYVRSTAYDRTLMSAYSVLAALYPPVDEVLSWKDDLAWQPIPVHVVPLEEDYLLEMNTACPVFTAAQEEYWKNNSIKNQTMKKYEDLFVYISDNSGEPNTWDGIEHVLDPIYCQSVSGEIGLPDWVTPQIVDVVVELKDIYATIRLPPKYAYLRGGPLLGEMLNHMINKSISNDITFPTKLFMYSAHDSTVTSFLMTLGLFNKINPPYTACVMVELHEFDPGDFRVLILYKNETDSEPYPLQLPSCDTYCPLEVFAQLMESSIPKDWLAECGLSVQQGFGEHVYAVLISLETSDIVAIILGSILAFILIITFVCLLKMKFAKIDHKYEPVPLEMN